MLCSLFYFSFQNHCKIGLIRFFPSLFKHALLFLCFSICQTFCVFSWVFSAGMKLRLNPFLSLSLSLLMLLVFLLRFMVSFLCHFHSIILFYFPQLHQMWKTFGFLNEQRCENALSFEFVCFL